MGINSLPEPVILADITGDIISGKNVGDFCAALNLVVSHMTKCFGASKFDVMYIK